MTPSNQLLAYDWRGTVFPGGGLSADALDSIASRLEDARREVVEFDQRLFDSQQGIPVEKQPLDAGFFRMPERILQTYHQEEDASELGRILQAARMMAAEVDQVVVLGIGGSYMGARAMMEACCHPFHNQLMRSERNGLPRMYFEGNNVDNDATYGLLDLLAQRPTDSIDQSWGIVVISKSGGTLETAVAFRLFLEALRAHCGGDAKQVAKRVIPVTGKSGKLFELSQALGCQEVFTVPDGVGGRFSVLSPVGLLPAALLGLDIERLLQGAIDMNDHFGAAPVGKNVVLDYLGVCHLLEDRHQINLRVLSMWSKALESVGLWYDQLLAESLGKQERGATPLTVVNTRDLHSRAQQHQEGTRDKLMTNVIVENSSRLPLAVPHSNHNEDELNRIAGRTMPEIMQAAIEGTNAAYYDDRRPTANISISRLDEYTLGQFFQMMMLATVVEGRMIGVNPYGQPGVEAYKKHMMKNLGFA